MQSSERRNRDYRQHIDAISSKVIFNYKKESLSSVCVQARIASVNAEYGLDMYYVITTCICVCSACTD